MVSRKERGSPRAARRRRARRTRSGAARAVLVGGRSRVADHCDGHAPPRCRAGLVAGVRGGGRSVCGESARMMSFGPWEWALAIFAALVVGVSKAGISGLGML